MTNERKAELFDKVMSWVYSKLEYCEEIEYEETLEEIGFTPEEIDKELREIFWQQYDEDDDEDDDEED